MIRKPFLNPYKNTPLEYNGYDKQYEDEYLINTTRPLGDKEISHIPTKNIFTFVENLLTDRHISNVLFSTNSKNEIKRYIHSNIITRRNANNFRKSSVNTKPVVFNPIKQKEQEKIFNIIKIDKKEMQCEAKKEKSKLIKKINELHFLIKKEKEQKATMIDSVNIIRMNNFNRSIQRCKSHLEKSPNFKLPEVELNLGNVYSRLYHNAVYLSSNDNSTKPCVSKRAMTASESTPNLKVKKKFTLKHVIEENKGKEFIAKVTDEIMNRCLFKHSGGPVAEVKRYFNKEDDEKCIRLNEVKNDKLILLKNAKDNFDNTYLHDAVLDSSIEFVRYYLQKNLSPNDKNQNGDTPLHFAMKEGNHAVIKLLLDYKGDLTIKNARKETPYDYATPEIKRAFKLEHRMNLKLTRDSAN